MELDGPTDIHTSVLTSLDQHTARRKADDPLVDLLHRVMRSNHVHTAYNFGLVDEQSKELSLGKPLG
jgi:hypothetical protein